MPAAYILIATASGFLITLVSELKEKMLISKEKTLFAPKFKQLQSIKLEAKEQDSTQLSSAC